MQDRRQDIIEAGLAVLREHGYTGFTQPRVAARAGLRQSHLTYYHSTRLDLLEAVGRAAIDRQLAAVGTMLGGLTSLDATAHAIATLVSRHENTRVLMALAQAADEEPRLREIFRELADGIVVGVTRLLGRFGVPIASDEPARLLHALSVGLAVVGLATGRADNTERAASVLRAALAGIATPLSHRADPAPNQGEKP